MKPHTLLRALVVGWVAALLGCSGSDDAPTVTTPQADTGGCALPSLSCAGVCRDLTSDRANCGACGRACGSGQVCSRGICASSCDPSLTRCAADGSCHDLRADPSHCGACGRACGSGQVCNRGVCTASCESSLTACGSGTCRDLSTDPFNCGACGRVCLAGEACTSGACALPAVCALGSDDNTTALTDASQLTSAALGVATVGATATTSLGQTFTVTRAGFLSGVEVSLSTCGGALTATSMLQLALRDELGQTLATTTLRANGVSNGACPRVPSSLSAGARTGIVFDLGGSCVPVSAGRRLSFVLTSTGATTHGTCPAGPAGTRRCSNAPTVACTSAAQCAGLPAIVSAGANLITTAHDTELVGGTAVAGAVLAFKTYVTPYVLSCGGTASCNGVCRDLTSDRANCGACGRTCSAARVCAAGVCATSCGPGLSTCGDGASAYCANTQSDNLNCGACGAACAAGQVCAAGACVTTCGAGVTTCGRGRTAYCANTATDNANCGVCGRVCAAGQVCSGGACSATCGGATTLCAGSCADTRYDPANCGACGRACSAGQVCASGVCALACGAGVSSCGNGALARCADTQNDSANCGACGVRCAAGQVCAAGACSVVCGAGATRCGAGAAMYCANTASDNANCGGCGMSCGAGTTCTNGRCDLTCATGQTACGGRCVDLAHDAVNCGACGRACSAGQVCSAGLCASVCSADDTRCGAACSNTRHDPDHCGGCATACPAGGPNTLRACADSTCGAICATGFGDCDTSRANGCESDLRTDALHCGACGRSCALPHAVTACAAAACAITSCEMGWLDCNGDPSDGCELQDGAACPIPNLCGTAVVGCYEHNPVCFLTSIAMAGTSCRPAAGVCDAAEVCDGTNPVCPADAFTTGTVCRPSASSCDAFEACDGTGAACPADALIPDGAGCDDGDGCTVNDTCQGGTCASGAPRTCTENDCQGAFCDRATGRCAPKPDGITCDDGDGATRRDMCFAGACRGFPSTDVAQIAVGRRHTLLRMQDGAVWAFGDNRRHQLGDGETVSRSVPVRVTGLPSVTDIVAGETLSAALGVDGAVYLWGELDLGAAPVVAPRPSMISLGTPRIVSVALGQSHMLLALDDGTVLSFGSNNSGQLGVTGPSVSDTLYAVPGLPAGSVVRVVAGGDFSLALTRTGEVWAWGANLDGQLGRPPSESESTPMQVMGLSGIQSLAASNCHVVALGTNGIVRTWGCNTVGQLGDGTTTSTPTPRTLGFSMGAPVAQVAAGLSHSLALTRSGALYGWGEGGRGALPNFGSRALVPTALTGFVGDIVLGAGGGHSLLFASNATGAPRLLWGSGEGADGQLGDDSFSASPRLVPGPAVGFGRYALNVLTQRNDTLRTGANLRETALTTANVRPSTFGRLFETPVQGDILAQPLYVQGAIRGRDTVYVATLDNYVYAIDALDGTVRWTRQVGTPLNRARYYWCGDLRGNMGIISTPVIDLARQTLYFTAVSVPAAAGGVEPLPEYRLHAVDIATGAERFESPVLIQAAVAGDTHLATEGSGTDPWAADPRFTTGSSGGVIRFSALHQMQRPGLLLQDGTVYLAFGGHCDLSPYHGWLMAYDADTLAQRGAMVTTPTSGATGQVSGTIRWDNIPVGPGNATGDLGYGDMRCFGSGGGIWQYGNGPASTGSGDFFVAEGNSIGVDEPRDLMASFAGGPAGPRASFSNAVLRIGWRSDRTLGVQNWFQPSDYTARDAVDDDLGSAGPMLVPGTDRVLVGGKGGTLYLLRREALGGYSTTNTGVLSALALPHSYDFGNIIAGGTWWASPAGGRYYLWAESTNLRAFSIDGDVITEMATDATSTYGVNRSTMSISADGSRAGTGILWSFAPRCGTGSGLLAYDAENIAAGPIYSSSQVLSDQLAPSDRSPVITVAQGRVYVGTLANRLSVFGLLPTPRSITVTPPANACSRSCPPSAGAYTGPVTWSDLYARFFGPGTEGHCQNCHSSGLHSMGTTAQSMYDGWRTFSSPLINTATPSASRVVNPSTSPLRWVNANGAMPQSAGASDALTLCNPAAVDALNRWIAAGARP